MEDRWDFINNLEDEYMKGGYILSEYVSELARTTDLAFVGGAWLAVVITSMAGIESYLRSELDEKDPTLCNLIDQSELSPEIKTELQSLRKYRNGWVHVDTPWDDGDLFDEQVLQDNLESMARRCLVALRKVIYLSPWI